VLRAQSPSVANTTKALTYGCCAYEDLLLPLFDAVADPSMSVRVFGVNVPKVCVCVCVCHAFAQEEYSAGGCVHTPSRVASSVLESQRFPARFWALSVLSTHARARGFPCVTRTIRLRC
jgi:hypothetical protein